MKEVKFGYTDASGLYKPTGEKITLKYKVSIINETDKHYEIKYLERLNHREKDGQPLHPTLLEKENVYGVYTKNLSWWDRFWNGYLD